MEINFKKREHDLLVYVLEELVDTFFPKTNYLVNNFGVTQLQIKNVLKKLLASSSFSKSDEVMVITDENFYYDLVKCFKVAKKCLDSIEFSSLIIGYTWDEAEKLEKKLENFSQLFSRETKK